MYVSRHHPVSLTAPVPHPTISPKWTKKQDQKLKQAVQKYGTQWSLISRKYHFDRSVNSLVKRWHGKLKEEIQKGISKQSNQSQSQDQKQEQTDKTKKIRKQQKKDQKRNSRRGHRKQQKGEYKRETREQYRSRRQSLPEKDSRQSNKNKMKSAEQELQNSQHSAQENNQQDGDSFEQSDSKFVFQHNWKQFEDNLLKEYIVNQKVLNWEQLAIRLKLSNSREVRKRWQTNIYPSITESRKIGGCLKYSEEQDAILSRGVKLGMTVQELRKFLPGRTQYSLDARRRRTLKMDQEQIPEHRYWIKKLSAHLFVTKRHQHLEKPAEEQQFMYRSQSE